MPAHQIFFPWDAVSRHSHGHSLSSSSWATGRARHAAATVLPVIAPVTPVVTPVIAPVTPVIVPVAPVIVPVVAPVTASAGQPQPVHCDP